MNSNQQHPYSSPRLTSLGTFREMTQAGGSQFASDGFSLFSPEQPQPARS